MAESSNKNPLINFFKNITTEIAAFLRFLVSKAFLKHLLIAAGIAVLLFFGVVVSLRAYTNYGESFPAPDFTGLKLEKATELATQNGLEIEVIDSTFIKSGERGTIIDQTPPPGFNVKKSRTIFLTRKKFVREKVSVPDLTDFSIKQARADLQTLGLDIKEIKYKSSRFQSLVLAQKYKGDSIKPGTKIPKGSDLTLVVGKKSNKKTRIPTLIGLTIHTAKKKILDQSLNVGSVIYDNSVETRQDTLNAKVWKQKPESTEEKITIGSTIDLWLTNNKTKLKMGKIEEKYN